MQFRFTFGLTLLCLLGACRSHEPAPTHVMRFHLEATEGSVKNTRIAKLPISGLSFTVDKKPALFEGDILNVELVQVDTGLCLFFQFTERASRELYRLSVTHTTHPLVLLINNHPIGFQKLDHAIEDGNLFMFVEVPDEDLPELIQDLKLSTKRVWELKG